MAITKAINGAAKTHGALRNTIEYVLRDDKVREGYVDVIGPSPDKITWDSVYQSFLQEKKNWSKDSGRMDQHFVLSFHKDEKITPAEALQFGRELFEKQFPGFQVLLGVHQDKDHLHVHAVVNSVSYENGKKLHMTKYDLQHMKDRTNEMCRERGLSVAEKGKHFDGTAIEEGTGRAWSKDKYHLINDESKKPYLVDCAYAVLDARDVSESREDFIREMGERGWTVSWEEKRKHVTFEDKEGHKVRDSNLSKTFTLDIGKEALEREFERQKEKHRADKERDAELEQYYRQVAAADAGLDTETVGDDNQTSGAAAGEELHDSKNFVRQAEADRRSAEASADRAAAERANRDYEQERSRAAARKRNPRGRQKEEDRER